MFCLLVVAAHVTSLTIAQGLKIKPYKKAKQNMNTDTELFALCKYLLQIAELPDLSHLDHSVRYSKFDL